MTVLLNALIPELYVTNLEVSLVFYEALGFRILYERKEEKFAFLQRENIQLMLEETGAESWLPGALELPLGRGVNFQMNVADIDLLYEISRARGFTMYKPLYEKWYRVGDRLQGNRQFLVQDPDGYLLRFF